MISRQAISQYAGQEFARPMPRRARFGISDYLFWLMMLMINVPQVLELTGIETIFKPYRVLSLLLALMAIPRILAESSRTRQFSHPIFIAVTYVAIMTAVFAGADALNSAPLIITCLALFFATYAVSSRRSLFIGLNAFVISFVVSAYFGLLAYKVEYSRMSGLFENPNSFGYGGCFVLILALNRYFPLKRFVRWFLVLATLPALFLTGSRGTLLSLVGGFVSQLWRNPRLFFGLGLVSILLGVGIYFFSDSFQKFVDTSYVFKRFSTSKLEEGSAGRVALIQAGLRVSAEHGFIGIGLGQYRQKHHTRFFQFIGRDGLQQLGLHNIYVSLLCEWGLVGFCCFGMVIYRLVRASRGLFFERDFIYGFIGVSLINGLGNDLLSEIHFWIILGVCIQLIRFAHEADDSQIRERRSRR